MFQYSTSTVIECLEDSVFKIGNVEEYIKALIGPRSENVLNRFFGLYANKRNKKNFSIISQFAAVLISIKIGPELIKHHLKIINDDANPSLSGWLLEIWFFASLRSGGVQLFQTEINPDIYWNEANTNLLDIESFEKGTLLTKKGKWYKPRKWNQGGYDAVFLYNNHQNKNIVIFVQITGADEHSFKIRFFSSLLNELKEFFEIHEIEIFFVVLKSKISTFIISPVEDIGALRPWNWQFSKEKEKCQIVGIDGWEKHYLRKLIL